ncbi:DUF4199 domain-containing protein [Paraflavitalea pollutisoli]|uniref:DUF4199 domain-containing protein n=1 Tax=Paraflavitalea pollutisoli TaxID=3034143 RepID=UPI0023EE0CC1|nr:DUF4199 domain-containing protein [Paraflavitalea sp. H1-2-19X]
MEKKTISAVTAGLITAAILIVLALVIYFTKRNEEQWPQYLGIGVYMVAIVAFINIHANQVGRTASFGQLLGFGFRIIPVVIILMVLYTVASNYMFPEVKQNFLDYQRTEALKLQNNTEAQIDENIKNLSKNYTILLVMGQLFFYMVGGALATVTGAVIAKKIPTSTLQNQ